MADNEKFVVELVLSQSMIEELYNAVDDRLWSTERYLKDAKDEWWERRHYINGELVTEEMYRKQISDLQYIFKQLERLI